MAQQDPDIISPGELAGDRTLADALESDRFRKFLDHIPFAVAVSELRPEERIIYANPELERLLGIAVSTLEGKTWSALPESARATASKRPLSQVVVTGTDYLGTVTIEHESTTSPDLLDAWSNVIQDDAGAEAFRLLALS